MDDWDEGLPSEDVLLEIERGAGLGEGKEVTVLQNILVKAPESYGKCNM